MALAFGERFKQPGDLEAQHEPVRPKGTGIADGQA